MSEKTNGDRYHIKTPMICTPCGGEITDGTQAIYGIEKLGRMVFGWTCCHSPVGDVAVILGSAGCASKWIEEHPEHRKAFLEMLDSTLHTHYKGGVQ